MGIKQKGFADWIASEFPGTVKPLPQGSRSRFETVCIDVNPILHTCLRNATDEPRFVKALFATLDRYFRLTVPLGTVYLAVDGSPPLAKMKEQIRRRKSKSPSKMKHMNSSQITPGCSFMLRITDYLRYYAARYLQKKQHNPFLRFIISGAESYGEGEAKIMQFLSSTDCAEAPVAIYSGDSDVIVQSMLSQMKQIYVIRPGEGDGSFTAVDVAGLRGVIISFSPLDTRIIEDFCVLVMFSGNDYIRKLRGCSIAKIWPIYKKWRQSRQSSGRWLLQGTCPYSFNFDVLGELLKLIRSSTIKRAFVPDMSISLAMLGLNTNHVQHEVVDADDDEDDEDDEIDLKEVRSEERSPSYTKHIPNYVQSVLWTMSMYTTGECPDFTFTQIGLYLTIEQLLTFIARDLPSSSATRLSTPRLADSPAFSMIPTFLCPLILLDLSSRALYVCEPWRTSSSCTTQDFRDKLIYSATFSNESHRVMMLICDAVTQVNAWHEYNRADQNEYRYLRESQPPTCLTQMPFLPRACLPLFPLGLNHQDAWTGIKITLPTLLGDAHLAVTSYHGGTLSTRKRPVHLNGWPFSLPLSKDVIKVKTQGSHARPVPQLQIADEASHAQITMISPPTKTKKKTKYINNPKPNRMARRIAQNITESTHEACSVLGAVDANDGYTQDHAYGAHVVRSGYYTVVD